MRKSYPVLAATPPDTFGGHVRAIFPHLYFSLTGVAAFLFSYRLNLGTVCLHP